MPALFHCTAFYVVEGLSTMYLWSSYAHVASPLHVWGAADEWFACEIQRSCHASQGHRHVMHFNDYSTIQSSRICCFSIRSSVKCFSMIHWCPVTLPRIFSPWEFFPPELPPIAFCRAKFSPHVIYLVYEYHRAEIFSLKQLTMKKMNNDNNNWYLYEMIKLPRRM